MKTLAFVALVAALLAGTLQAGPLKVAEQTKLQVENDWYRLVIDAAQGGAIRSFVYKPFDANREWIYPVGGGLLEDMIWQQQHPGELQDHAYAYKILEQSPDVFRVELWRAFAQEPYKALVMRKTIMLRADSPAIRVRMTLENPTAQDMFPGAWVQNRFFGGGNKGVPVSYRPSYLGIRMSYYENGRGTGDDFVRRPTAGWATTFDRETGAGFLGLVDYNYLQQQYSCLPCYTMEFFFDRVLIRAGQSWSTEYMLVPVTGMKNCFYADANLFLSARQDGDRVTFEARATDAPVPLATIKVRAEKPDRSAVLGEASADLRDLRADKPQPVTLQIPGVDKQPVNVALTLTVAGQTRTAEFQYARDPAMYHLQESAVSYRAVPPKKQKPELMGNRNLQLQHKPGLQVFYAMGLWHELNRVKEALAAIDPKVQLDESVFRTGTLGPELSRQPLLAEELLGYDLVVLNNVGANALGEPGEIAVKQYVDAGGNLLVCGGVYSLGKSRWDESVLAEVLPVETAGFFDLEQLPEFTSVGDDLGSVKWIQTVRRVKPGAQVLLDVAGKPLLVQGACGKGKVLVWLGTPMGDPPAGVTPYWESPNWVPALGKVLENVVCMGQGAR
jgi:hypothetical protein